MYTSIKNGILVISLDFELFWGLADVGDILSWKDRIIKVHDIVPQLLDIFTRYNIHTTWATVGGILATDRKDFLSYLSQPICVQTKKIIDRLWPELSDSFTCPDEMLFSPELLDLINSTPGQELGSHTYSHYYCSHIDSDVVDFQNELNSSIRVFKQKGYSMPRSVVFPRNQVCRDYIDSVPSEMDVYRGEESGIVTKIKKRLPLLGTIIWYVDHYVPLRNSRSYDLESCVENGHINVRQSRFFKAYKHKYSLFEPLKMRRYKHEMLHAAKQCEIYHICWHPHNFSENTKLNLAQIEELMKYYDQLKTSFGMESLSMCEVADRIE